ncbi:MAG TPA: hypothetical protein VGH38_04220 [Bryobacteraceae bacterium]|jgi:WD40 repeat protein
MIPSPSGRASPYPGLAPFGEGDAARFFGRDREIDEVLGRLASRRLLAVIGVSGCGKSSLVRAGVMPVLRMGVAADLPARWRLRTITPGRNPLRSLGTALGAPPGWPANSFDLVDRARNHLSPGESLLLIVDQFEEVFRFRAETLAEDGGNAASLFINLLLNAVDQRDVPIYVLLTMRTDFLGACAQFRGLPEALNDCYYLVPRMTRLQQQEAIERPLLEQGEVIHPALTQRLLNDSAEDPDHLPVLQHLLRRLWENWSARGASGAIELEDYDAVGGWTNALRDDAEAVLARFAAEEEAIRRVFQWITERGTGEQAIRRPRPFGECVDVSGLNRDKLREVILAFQERGLLRPSDGTDGSLVELPHESVTWQWSRLKRWIVEEAEQAAQMRFLLYASHQQMPLTGLALESGLHLQAEWRQHRLPALRYFEPEELEQTDAWIDRSSELDRSQRNLTAARELSAWAAVSLGSDPERSLILGLFSWAKQRTMVLGLEEFLHEALLRSPSRLTLSHPASVWSIVWSPDGSRLATASSDSLARVWDAGTGHELLTLAGHESVVSAIAWSPGGSKLATGSFDKAVKVWDAVTGRELLTLSGHRHTVLGVSWSPDGDRLATASDDNTAKLWDVATGRELLTFSGHAGAVRSIAWSPDGKKVATGSYDRTAKIWEAGTGRELLVLTGHENHVESVAWSPDGSTLATASLDQTVSLWDTAAGQEVFTLRGHQHYVLNVAWSPDGSRFATASFDGTTKVWEAETGRELFTLHGHQYAVLGIAWSPDGNRLATASDDTSAKVWQVGPGGELLTFLGHRHAVWSIAWSPDGEKLATGSDDQTAVVWEAATGRALLLLRGHETWVESVAWSPDSGRLSTSFGSSAKIWEVGTGRELAVLRGHEAYVGGLAWAPGGKRLATASRDKTAKIWEAESGRDLLTLRGHEGHVRSVAWSPDGSKVATASDDTTARIWDAESGAELLSIRGHQYPVSSVAWSPDGSSVATASSDHTARVWDANSGGQLFALLGHLAAILSIAWSPDGRMLATAGWDRTVIVWDAATGSELLTLRAHQLPVRSVTWSPDSKRLAASGDDGIVQVYVIDHALLLNLVRSRITRQLTLDECRRFLNTNDCPPLPDLA